MFKNERTWVLAADSAKAKIFEWLPHYHNLQEIVSLYEEDIRNSESDPEPDHARNEADFTQKDQYSLEEHAI